MLTWTRVVIIEWLWAKLLNNILVFPILLMKIDLSSFIINTVSYIQKPSSCNLNEGVPIIVVRIRNFSSFFYLFWLCEQTILLRRTNTLYTYKSGDFDVLTVMIHWNCYEDCIIFMSNIIFSNLVRWIKQSTLK